MRSLCDVSYIVIDCHVLRCALQGKTTFKDTRSSSRVVKYKQRNSLHANYKLPFKDNFVLEGILLEQMHNYAVPSCNYAI